MEENSQIKEVSFEKRLFRLEALVQEKNTELKNIYGLRSWRIFLFACRLRRAVAILLKTVFKLFGVTVLFIFTLLATIYLYLLKKLRKSEIFPGG